MENYVKEILFGYPLLKTVGRDYEIHIRNKAVLSHFCAAEPLAEYLAGEIISMHNLEALRGTVENVLGKLSAEERALVEIRYFGKRKKIRSFLKKRAEKCGEVWSEAKYFRRQRAVGEKVAALLLFAGVTEERYLKEFSKTDIFKKIHTFVSAGKDKVIAADERRWMEKR